MKKLNLMKLFGTLALTLATSVALTVVAVAQQGSDIVIVNQDGEKVPSSEIQIFQPKPAGAQSGANATGGVKIKVKGAVENRDGKWVVTDAEGNEQELDIQGAQSIIINQAVESVTENGENKTKRVGKAIIVGPDGTRHEIELGGAMLGGAAEFDFPGFNGIVSAESVNSSFMIGVNCQPVSEAMSAQLGLDAGTGLVVVNVSSDSPAQAAGIEKHDILMFADDRQLANQSDLLEVVQTAGKEKAKISLTVIRAGKEIGIEVSPVERPASQVAAGMPNIFRAFPENNGNGFNMQFRQMGPGLILDEDFDNGFQMEFENQMKEMEARMDALRKKMEQQLEAQLKNSGTDK